MKRWLISVALIAGVIVGAGLAAGAVAAGSPPVSADGTTLTLHCDAKKGRGFDVQATLEGKFGAIELASGTVISTSPGLKATLTAHGKTLTYVISGVSTYTFLSDRIEVTSTGLNILMCRSLPGSSSRRAMSTTR